MMKNSPHDASKLHLPEPKDDNGRILTYEETVIAMRAKMGLPAGSVQEMELEPQV